MTLTLTFIVWSFLSVDAPNDVPAPALPVIEIPPAPGGEELEGRRRRVFDAMSPGVLVVEAGRPEEGSKVDRDFYYLTGAEVPGGALVLDKRKGREPRAVLYLPPHSRQWERWNGPRLFPGPGATGVTGVADTRSLDEYEKALAGVIAEAGRLYVPRARADELQEKPGKADREILATETIVHPIRMIKSEYELEMLRWAIAGTGRALSRCMRDVRPGLYEFQVQSFIEGGFLAEGLGAPGFKSIIGSGPNNCILHYTGKKRRMEPGELLLLDIGAEAAGYTADISRTLPVSGRFTPRQREIYELVLKAQKKTIAAVRPGVTLRDLNRVTRQVFAEKGLRRHFPHGVTHHVGLEVHDVQPHGTLAPGMVITIEPGLYFEDEDFGVRIEDMVRVTDDGCEVLSAAIPKEPEEVEALTSAR